MKAPKYLLAALAVSFSLSAFSQESQKTQKTAEEVKESKVSTWGVYPPPAQQADSTADHMQSRTGQLSFPAPNFGSYYIPVLGNYNSSESDSQKQITITGDEKNAGKVWIEGIAPVKVYALLKVPGIYKIPAQKNTAEGTLVYDDSNKQVNICLGCGYKEKDPTAFIENKQSSAKSKTKAVRNFTGIKTDQGTVSNQ